MSQPLRDYFALEAGEYLEQMDALLAAEGAPDAERFFRLARGVRGSAQVADATEIATVAARLEQVARALREGRLPLSENVRVRAVRTVDDLRVLVRGHRHWGPAEEARAREAVARWTEFGDARPATPAAGGEAQLFAFARREIEAVVAELDRVLGEMRRAPAVREPLRWLLRRMRPIRGLAGVSSLAGVAEVLEGIEEQAQELLSGSRPVEPAELALLEAGHDALLAFAGALEDGGAGAAPDAALDRFRALREERSEGGEDDVVPIAALFHDDDGPHIVSSSAAPVPLPGDAPEAVLLFLRIEATGFLDRAEALLAEGGGRTRGFARVARQLADLARAVGELAASYGLAHVAQTAERAGAELREARDADAARGILGTLRAVLPGAESAAEPGEGVVPIEELLLRGAAALRAAHELRPRVDDLVAEQPELAGMLGELWALLELAAEPEATVTV